MSIRLSSSSTPLVRDTGNGVFGDVEGDSSINLDNLEVPNKSFEPNSVFMSIFDDVDGAPSVRSQGPTPLSPRVVALRERKLEDALAHGRKHLSSEPSLNYASLYLDRALKKDKLCEWVDFRIGYKVKTPGDGDRV
ncbi:hypothetical protein AgCh_018121 [Apium graveolens]